MKITEMVNFVFGGLVGDMAQLVSACLPFMKPRVQTVHPLFLAVQEELRQELAKPGPQSGFQGNISK